MQKLLWTILIISFVFFGCRKNKEKYIIPKDKFKNILVELHLADGIYMHNYSKYLFHNDSLNFYNDIFDIYGYSKEQFDTTMKWYTNHPKQFEIIYDDVVNELNKTEQQYLQLRKLEEDSASNLYKGKKVWVFPKDSLKQHIPFNLRIRDSSTYTIYVFAKVYPDDKTVNPKIVAYYWTNNGTKEGKRDYFPEVYYHKSKHFVLYSTNLTMPNNKITHLKGYILNNKTKKSLN